MRGSDKLCFLFAAVRKAIPCRIIFSVFGACEVLFINYLTRRCRCHLTNKGLGDTTYTAFSGCFQCPFLHTNNLFSCLSALPLYLLLNGMAIVAHERTDLPTVTEMETSLNVLNVRTNAIKVVRVRQRFAVKISYSIPPLEAENMIFVAHNSNVPVLKVHNNFVDPET